MRLKIRIYGSIAPTNSPVKIWGYFIEIESVIYDEMMKVYAKPNPKKPKDETKYRLRWGSYS